MALCASMTMSQTLKRSGGSVFDLESLTDYRAEGDPRKTKFMMDNRMHDLKMRGQAVVKKH